MNARTIPGRTLAVLLSLGLSQVVAPAVHADGHLLTPDQAASRVADRAAERAAQVKTVQAILETPEARQQAGVLGASLPKLRAAVPHLSDTELADLSARAAQVKDVAAGHHGGDEGLIILAIVLVVAAVAVLIAASGDGYYDDCGCYY